MKVKAMQLQLPWEVSESSSQLLFRGEVKKFGSSRNFWSILPGRPMLSVWHQDSYSSQGRSSSNLPKPFHTHHTQIILAGFSQISFWRDQSPFCLFVSIYIFVCHYLFPLSKRSQQFMSNKSAWSNRISALYLVQPGQEITRRHDRTELAVWLNHKKQKPHWLLFWALSYAGVLY